MRFEYHTWDNSSDVEFAFPRWGVGVNYLAVCGYRRGRGHQIYVGGPAVHHVPMADRYIRPVPPGAVRHAAATRDPTLLLDWLLENACDARPWLAEAINAAIAGAAA